MEIKVSIEDKSLLLAGEFDLVRNFPLAPNTTSPSHSEKLWWICASCQNKWKTFAHTRVQGSGCPKCKVRGAATGVNDLQTKYPEIAAEWDYEKNPSELNPSNIAGKSSKRIWWTCGLGHSWEAPVSNRTSNGTGCPVCAGKSVLVGYNDLESLYPDIATQWDYELNDKILSPSSITYGSKRKVWWKCAEGHSWGAAVSARTGSGSNCPFCAGNRVVLGTNDLYSSHPELFAELHPSANAESVTRNLKAGSHAKVWWMCGSGHEWLATPKDRTRSDRPTGCPKCYGNISRMETAISEFIGDRCGGIQLSTRKVIPPYELDIYIPEKNIAIEFNGLYWHSEARKTDKNYHWNKYKACANKGVQLIQIWEDEWTNKQHLVERLLESKLGIMPGKSVYARNTTAQEITSEQAKDFLNENHIQGFGVGSRYLGLIDSGSALVAVMALKKTGIPGEWLLNRYATSAHVVGGHSKLLNFFCRTESDWKRIVTFADLCVSDGKLYETTGWKKDRILQPDYSYLYMKHRVHKFNFRIKNFKNNPDLKFEEGLTERELAQLNGLHRIWDAGKIRYTYDNPHPRG